MVVVWDVPPVLAVVAGVELRTYSILLVASLVGGYLLFRWQVLRAGGAEEDAGEFFPLGYLAVLVGARCAHVWFYEPWRFLTDPPMLFRYWEGGMASHGAVVGAALALRLYTRPRGLSWLEGADRLVASGALAVVLVRLGNLFNSELVGTPTHGQWGIVFPIVDGAAGVPRHPVQLYEAAVGLALLVALIVADRWRARPRGFCTGVFLIGYFGARMVVECWRARTDVDLGWVIGMAQLLSAPFFVVGALLLARSLVKRETPGWILPGFGPTGDGGAER